ncbi:MAG: alpha/beta fold hydrolase, partial [Polyangiaceae bacterium]
MQHATARVRDAELHYLRAGIGDPVFLIAGWPQTSYAWRRVIPLLAPRYTVIAPDLRGQGASERCADGYDAASIAADLRELAASLGFERVRVVGHGLGVFAAFAFAAIHRESVEQLVVLDAPLAGFVPDEVLGDVPASLAWPRSLHSEPDLAAMLTARRERKLLQTVFAGTDGDEYVRWHSSADALRAGLAYHRTVAQGALDGVAPLSIPVLALGGERSMGERMARAFRSRALDVTGAIVPGAGHFLHEEKPDDVARRIAAFFGDGAK